MSLVPNTNTFNLQNVTSITGGSSLQDAFDNSIDLLFDPTYKGDKTNLLNFRNYGYSTSSFTLSSWDNISEINWYNSSWSTLRESVYGQVNSDTPLKVGNKRVGSTYYIRRTFIRFDLSSLSGKTCCGARINWGVTSKVGNTNLYVLEGTQSVPVQYSDFSSFTSTLLLYSCAYYSQTSPPYYVVISTPSAYFSTIESYFGGYIDLVLLSEEDYINSAPGDGIENNVSLWITGEALSGNVSAPSLSIDYR